MKKITNQISSELNVKIEWIKDLEIDESNHVVTFNCGATYMARLVKSNKSIRKNSIRKI